MATGDLPAAYQDIPQAAQLWAALAVSTAYGQATRIAAITEKLANFGLTPDA
jgi:hypothetical protein